MTANQWIPILVIVINIPIFLLVGRAIFGSWSLFFECLKWNFIPDWWSLARGKLARDFHGENKTGMFIVACTSIVMIQIIVISNFI